MSGSFESERWNACLHRLDLSLYSHLKEFLGNGVRIHVNSKGKIPSTGGSEDQSHNMQDSEPNTLPTEPFWPQSSRFNLRSFYCVRLIKLSFSHSAAF